MERKDGQERKVGGRMHSARKAKKSDEVDEVGNSLKKIKGDFYFLV